MGKYDFYLSDDMLVENEYLEFEPTETFEFEGEFKIDD